MTADRKQMIRAYKDRPRDAGVFAVRRLVDDRRWVGATPDLATRQTGVWFALNLGGHPNRGLQASSREAGETAFVFEVLEVINDADLSPMGRADALKAAKQRWASRPGAERLA